MRRTRVGIVATALLAVSMGGLGGCMGDRVAGGTGVGNPPQSSLAFTMVADKGADPASKRAASPEKPGPADTALPVTDKSGTAFVLRRAVTHVGLVKVKLPEGVKCGQSLLHPCEADEFKIEGSFVADLLAGTFTPPFPTLQAPHGEYRRVDVRLEALEAGHPAVDTGLIGHSMILSGTFAYGGRADRAFTIVLDFNEEIRYDSGFSRVREAPINLLKLRLDADRWLADSDIGGCLDSGSLELDDAGDLRIDDENSCEGLEQTIKDGVKASGTLEEGE